METPSDWEDRLARWQNELELFERLDETPWVTLARAEAETAPRNPIRGVLVGCCACAETQTAKSMVQSVIIFMLFNVLLTPI